MAHEKNRRQAINALVQKIKPLLRNKTNERERLETVWNVYQSSQYYVRQLSAPFIKSLEMATKLKEEGNVYFRNRAFTDAIISYNNALMLAPPDSDLVGQLYANRAAAYLEYARDPSHLKICLENIELALQSNCPPTSRAKLEDRRQRCLAKLEEFAAAGIEEPDPIQTIPFSYPPNPKFRFVCEGIDVTMTKDGVQFRALRDFKAGDIVFKDPYLFKAVSDRRALSRFCRTCLSPHYLSLIPCKFCTVAMFCSEKCATDWIHQVECPILGYVLFDFDPDTDRPVLQPLCIRALVEILEWFPDRNQLRRKIQEWKKDPERLLKTCDAKDPKIQLKQITRMAFSTWPNVALKTSLPDFDIEIAIDAAVILNFLLYSKPFASKLSDQNDRSLALQILFNFSRWFNHELEVADQSYGMSHLPLEFHFKRAEVNYNIGLITSPVVLDGRYGQVMRPIKKGDSLVIRKMTPRFHHYTHSDVLKTTRDAFCSRNTKRMIELIKTDLPRPLATLKGLKISEFDPDVDLFGYNSLAKEGKLKEKLKRFCDVLNKYDAFYPCFELYMVQWALCDASVWHYVNNKLYLHSLLMISS